MNPSMNKTSPSTPFPTLMFDAEQDGGASWPSIPIEGYRTLPLVKGAPQACEIESLSGTRLRGDVLDFEPRAARLMFRPQNGASPGWMRFSNFRRLTLLVPLTPATQMASVPMRLVSTARQARTYTLARLDAPQAPLLGRTVGHCENSAGMFLYAPADDSEALHRVFVPRSAYDHCSFGLSAMEIAESLWIRTERDLLDALGRQDKGPVAPIGQSLLALGLLTQSQLDRALSRPADGLPLGEALVAARLISQPELLMAIAHKMGYPMVDLRRFPVDPRAVGMVPRERLLHHRILPLMQDGGRLIVAFDRPSRLVDLRSIHLRLQAPIVPVLAAGMQIGLVLERMSADVWHPYSAGRAGVVAH